MWDHERDVCVPVRSFSGMRPHMGGDRAALRESSVAHRTPERLLPGVRPRVRRQVRRLAERLRARVTPSRMCNIKYHKTRWIIQVNLYNTFHFANQKTRSTNLLSDFVSRIKWQTCESYLLKVSVILPSYPTNNISRDIFNEHSLTSSKDIFLWYLATRQNGPLHQPERLLAGVRAQVSLEGAGPGVRLAAYPAEIWPAVVFASSATYGVDASRSHRWTASTDADRRMFATGELQSMMRLGVWMGVDNAATAADDQAIGDWRGRIHPRLRCSLHRIVLRGGTQKRLHAPSGRIALLVPAHMYAHIFACMRVYVKIYAHLHSEEQG